MFEALTERLQGIFSGLGRRGTLRPIDVDTALGEIRLALLDADVHQTLVYSIADRVRERALSEEVSRAIDPAQQVARIVHQELSAALGEPGRLHLTGPKPRAIMLVGLQGSGKTTSAAKLARSLRAGGERPWLAAADPYRPAAAEQLRVLGEQLKVPVSWGEETSAVELAMRGVQEAANGGASVVILDTAGRSQLDREMMAELKSTKERIRPAETLLVADAMTGQEAVRIAQGFHSSLQLSGLILTKMDGDARGGAAISMRSVTGVPIKFVGVGEHLDDLESFEPDRLASRILGMGDVIGLIERAEAQIDLGSAEEQAQRMASGEFTLEDFSSQLTQLRRLGPLSKVMGMLPSGLTGGMALESEEAERRLIRTQAIIQSMTPVERVRPTILNASRKRRVAAGSGTTVQEVNQLLKQYRQMRRLFKKLGKRGLANLPF